MWFKNLNLFKSSSKKIWLVALFGLFLSASTQMLYSHLVLFLKFRLGVSETIIAGIDGFVEFLSYLIRIFSGAISDYLYDRKLLLLIGCSVAFLVKPIFAFAHSLSSVVFAEIAERLGSGIQAAPRDALIADLSPFNKLGSSFGFCKSMKTVGGILGAILAVAIIHFSDNNYRLLFISAAIPALLAFFCIIKIRNPNNLKKSSDAKKFDNPFKPQYLKSLDKNFWWLIFLAFVCELGHFTESLLTVCASQFLPVSISGITTVFAALGQILFAYFMGIAADKIEKISLLKICLILILSSYAALFFVTNAWIFLPAVAILCGQFASMQLLFLTIINSHVSSKLRGTAIGIFYFAIGISYMMSSFICGWLSEIAGYSTAFKYIFVMAAIAAFLCFRYDTHYRKHL